MSGRRLSYVFFFLAVAITSVSGEDGSVSFYDTTVTLTCPATPDLKWHQAKDELTHSEASLDVNDYDDNKGVSHYCTYFETGKNVKHYFYIKAKVCKGCVDLDMGVAMGVVFGDVLITVGIMLMVYVCARRKAETAAPQRATQARQARGQARGPTPPDPDYQPLNPATRSNDVYAHPQRR